jgi:hypothetical protein
VYENNVIAKKWPNLICKKPGKMSILQGKSLVGMTSRLNLTQILGAYLDT